MKKYIWMMLLILLVGCSDEKIKEASGKETAGKQQEEVTKNGLTHDITTEDVPIKSDDEMVDEFLHKVNLYYEDFNEIYKTFNTNEASNDITANIELSDFALKKQDELIVIPFLELQDMEYQKIINKYYDSLVEGYSLLIDSTFGSYQVSKQEMTQEEYARIQEDLTVFTKTIPDTRNAALEYFNERTVK